MGGFYDEAVIDTLTQSAIDLKVHDLGAMAYAEALRLQRDFQRQVIEARQATHAATPMHLLLVEHVPPVVTVSRRPGARKHLVATDRQLADAGIDVVETDRGGDITYHGPGQLVAYPILDLNVLKLRSHSYLRFLEQVVIDLLAHWALPGRRDDSATGVWLGEPPGAKICAVGVRLSRWVSMHGLALNVTTDLAHFDLIVPCGLTGRSVTSLRQQLGPACPSMGEVKRRFIETFRAALTRRPAPAPPAPPR
jgi:lipoyl(octanoyl) transferase